MAKLRQAIALIREAWPDADANQAAPTGSEAILEAEAKIWRDLGGKSLNPERLSDEWFSVAILGPT